MKYAWFPERGERIESLKRFLQKPWSEKVKKVKLVFLRIFGVIPVRLPLGGWWLAYNDATGNEVVGGRFETAERRFVIELLGPGMTVLDIGAHHGLYTLLAARRVGPKGRVVAFEPSPRERRKLVLNVRLNRCANVQIENCALGSSAGEADFFLVDGIDTGCNSLRPPNVKEPTRVVHVPVNVLDVCLRLRAIDRIDFIKMDVEGGEREVLKGAVELLDRRPRPVILCEVQDHRAEAWGYQAREVIEFLSSRGFHWFCLPDDGGLEEVDCQQENFCGNFVAIPQERLEQFRAAAHGRRAEEVTQA
jgi:FkbM family methyltransferase